jgi:hypothetical protein
VISCAGHRDFGVSALSVLNNVLSLCWISLYGLRINQPPLFQGDQPKVGTSVKKLSASAGSMLNGRVGAQRHAFEFSAHIGHAPGNHHAPGAVRADG